MQRSAAPRRLVLTRSLLALLPLGVVCAQTSELHPTSSKLDFLPQPEAEVEDEDLLPLLISTDEEHLDHAVGELANSEAKKEGAAADMLSESWFSKDPLALELHNSQSQAGIHTKMDGASLAKTILSLANAETPDSPPLVNKCPAEVVIQQSPQCSGHARVEVRGKHMNANMFCARIFEPLVHSDSEKWYKFDDPHLPPALQGGLFAQFPHEIDEDASIIIKPPSGATKVFVWYNNDTRYWEKKGTQGDLGPGYAEECKEAMPSALRHARFSERTRGPWYDVNSKVWKLEKLAANEVADPTVSEEMKKALVELAGPPDHGMHMEMWSKDLEGNELRLDFGKVDAKGGPQSCFTTAGIVLQGPCSLSVTVNHGNN